MIKIEYQFENYQEKEAREFIDRAKWKDVVTQMSIYLLRQENSSAIPEAEQMVYYRLRQKMLQLVHNSGLTL